MALRVGLAQINVTVGDIDGNIDRINHSIARAAQQQVDLLVFPEMCICGYPPEDLLHKPKFLTDSEQALDKVAPHTSALAVVVGLAQGTVQQCYNTAAVLHQGQIQNTYQKGLLPNYGVFDEKRYFTAGQTPTIFELNGLRIAVTICEDIWNIDWLNGFFAECEFDLIVNLSASPFYAGKFNQRKQILIDCARHFKCPVAYCNLVGGQDELVFDGRSMVLDAQGQVVSQADEFEEELCIVDLNNPPESIIAPVTPSHPIR